MVVIIPTPRRGVNYLYEEYMKSKKTIPVIGFDPSITNWGWAKATVDVDTLEFEIDDLGIIHTEPETKKAVVKLSDNLRRAKIVHDEMIKVCEGMAMAMTEIPIGTPSLPFGANLNSGIVTGLLGACPIPIIQVFPKDVKQLAVGSRNADKSEMIEWAVGKFPNAPWKYRTVRGKQKLINSNEHMADAVAVINAGLQTEQFKQARALFKSLS